MIRHSLVSVSICFPLYFAEVCKTLKRGHVLGGLEVFDVNTKHPGNDKLMFDFDFEPSTGGGGARGRVHSNELSTCIPLHVVVGKESKEVCCVDMGQFFVFTERVRTEGLVARNEGESLLKLFHVMYHMDISAEQK